jgi:hypothetical protein
MDKAQQLEVRRSAGFCLSGSQKCEALLWAIKRGGLEGQHDLGPKFIHLVRRLLFQQIPIPHPAQDTPKYEDDHSTDHWA